jgi:membrane-bound serine protease (ClpP class)
MDWWLVFAVFLFFASAALLVAEVFVPSGGLLSVCSIACLGGGVVIFFNYGTTIGWVGIIFAIIMIPTVLILAYRIFPKTKFGKTVTLTPPERELGDAIPDTDRLKELLGKTGVVLTAGGNV